MRPALAIVDPLSPRPYSGDPTSLAGLGGTEATVAKVAEGLGVEVVVHQRARQEDALHGEVLYAPFDAARPLPGAPPRILVINSWKVALKLRRHHPDAEIAVWLHVFPGRHNRAMGRALAEAGIAIVCVSRRQAEHLRRFLHDPTPEISHVPNPIDDELRPGTAARDRDLLLFASSPHKGLDQVFRAFERLRTTLPSMRLVVADPGYLRWRISPVPEGVELLGRLKPTDLQDLMRRALCLFYPQTFFAETFGLVIAEANALGCPALLHRGLGANDEVASDVGQLIDAGKPMEVEARIRAWRTAPPLVRGRPEYRLSAVQDAWRVRLGLAEPARAARAS